MPIPLLLPAIAAMAGSIGNSVIQGQSRRTQNAKNEKLAKQQKADNLEIWKRQNEYNDPSAQMQRLQNAGINPRFIYGSSASSATGNASDVKGYDRAENKATMEGFSAFDGIMDNTVKGVQTDNIKAQTDNAQQQKLLIQQDALKRALESKRIAQDIGFDFDKHDNNLKLQVEELHRSQNASAVSDDNKEISNSTKAAKIQTFEENLKLIISKYDGQELENQLKAETVQLAKEGLSWSDPAVLRVLSKLGLNKEEISKWDPQNWKFGGNPKSHNQIYR